MTNNKNLCRALKAKKDEFYTQFCDIENELRHYKEKFKRKTVYCNCDNPYKSEFFRYFVTNFKELGLRRLFSTHYDPTARNTMCLEINETTTGGVDVDCLGKNKKNKMFFIEGNGDFRSPQCVEILKKSDIIVTNPPFSLFRECITQCVENEKNC